MFRKMRRGRQALSREECIDVLRRATSGVLAVSGDGGYPYAVPLSYVYDDRDGGRLYFHCALTGHKLDAIARNEKVSFCVVDQDCVSPAEYTTHYRSVIAFGAAHVLTDVAEKRQALEILAERYCPEQEDKAQVIDEAFDRVCMVRLDIRHLTGKQAKELLAKEDK